MTCWQATSTTVLCASATSAPTSTTISIRAIAIGPGNTQGHERAGQRHDRRLWRGAAVFASGQARQPRQPLHDRRRNRCIAVAVHRGGAGSELRSRSLEHTVRHGDFAINTQAGTTTRYYGLYATDTLSITQRLDLTLAGRYNRAQVDINDRNRAQAGAQRQEHLQSLQPRGRPHVQAERCTHHLRIVQRRHARCDAGRADLFGPELSLFATQRIPRRSAAQAGDCAYFRSRRTRALQQQPEVACNCVSDHAAG